MRNALPASLPKAVPSDMSNCSRIERAKLVGVVALAASAPRSACSSTRRVGAQNLQPPARGPRRASPPRDARGGERRSAALPPAACRAPRAGRRADSSPACRERSPSCSPASMSCQSQYDLRKPRGPAGGQRLLRHGVEAEARRQHEALLRGGHGDVHSPFVVAVVDGADRRDRVHDEQRRMAGAVHRAANLGDAARHARRRLVVHDHDRLDRVGPDPRPGALRRPRATRRGASRRARSPPSARAARPPAARPCARTSRSRR